MTGWRLTALCWLMNHAEPVWAVETHGHGWRCPTCMRFRVSQLYKGAA
jgi:hypothetical protein